MYVNIVLGVILLVAALLGYLLSWFEDYLPYVAAGILILLSIKQFYHNYKSVSGKLPTLIIVIEFLLVLALGGLLIYLQDHVGIFIGLIVYLRGLSYLLVDYVTSEENKLLDYLLHIVYITFGSFLIFTTIDTDTILVLFIALLLLLLGAIYLQAGITSLVKKEQAEEQFLKEQQEHLEQVLAEQDEVATKDEQDEIIEDLEEQLEECEDEQEETVEDEQPEEVPEPEEPEPKQTVPSVQELEAMTVADLKTMAKEHDLQGYSSLNKAELILFLREELTKQS
jgi:ABC-type multidrug transport system fused ATPase/permease subunit